MAILRDFSSFQKNFKRALETCSVLVSLVQLPFMRARQYDGIGINISFMSLSTKIKSFFYDSAGLFLTLEKFSNLSDISSRRLSLNLHVAVENQLNLSITKE